MALQHELIILNNSLHIYLTYFYYHAEKCSPTFSNLIIHIWLRQHQLRKLQIIKNILILMQLLNIHFACYTDDLCLQ